MMRLLVKILHGGMQGRGTRVQPMYACFTLVVLLTCSSVAAVPITCAAHETHGGDVPASSISHAAADGPILVVGSINVDTIIHLDRLPMRSETRMALQPSPTLAVGGKGANQAVAAARLTAGTGRPAVRFVTRLGQDAHLTWLESELGAAGLDMSGTRVVPNMTNGAGVVWLDAEGSATSVVLGGANTEGWPEAEEGLAADAERAVQGVAFLQLQREVPERVNTALAEAAARAGVPVLLDAGGSDAPLSGRLLAAATYLAPNEQELQRLTGLPTGSEGEVVAAARLLRGRGAANVLATLEGRGSLLLAQDGRLLRQPALPVPGGVVVDATAAGDAFRAAFAVGLVEGMGLEGALLLGAAAGAVACSRLGALPSLPTRTEVDALLATATAYPATAATAADCSAATAAASGGPSGAGGAQQATAAASHAQCTAARDAQGSASSAQSAAGCCHASPGGTHHDEAAHEASPHGSSAHGQPPPTCTAAAETSETGAMQAGENPPSHAPSPLLQGKASLEPGTPQQDTEKGIEPCPLLFAARLNSMRARRDLVESEGDGDVARNDPLGWVARQGRVTGLGTVYFNYPEHMHRLTHPQVTSALRSAGLTAAGVNMRFPNHLFSRGALTHPEQSVRERAVELCVEGCGWAAVLGGRELVVWAASDGYDHHFQVHPTLGWDRAVASFQAIADRCAPLGVNVSLEWKPTDPATRFSFVPNTAAALLLTREVDRPNFGLTLDTGHMQMGGEHAAASVVAVARAGKLFGLHLNDGHGRAGEEDGLPFGSVHAVGALELVYWLRALRYSGTIYFDTFPANEDPVAEAELNIRTFRNMWARAGRLETAGVAGCMARQDGLCALRLLEAVV